MTIIAVSGVPGAGKTTLAKQLAAELAWPLVMKDDIKETLGRALADRPIDAELSQRLGYTSVQVMFGVARWIPQVVLECAFHPGLAEGELLALQRPVIQIYCRVDPQLAKARFRARIEIGERDRVHHGEVDKLDVYDSLDADSYRLELPDTIEVDTSISVNISALAQEILTRLS